jgi:hypothetical protein
MEKSKALEILKTKGVVALGRKLRPGAEIADKSLDAWTRRWLTEQYIPIPRHKAGRKKILVFLKPDPYTGGGTEPKSKK